jgi:hypothetical protein
VGDLAPKYLNVVGIMADQQQWNAGPVQHGLQLLPQVLAKIMVQRGERFIQQQRLRLRHQGARQGGTLALATGDLRGQ